jgi:serine/threonine protein kinase
MADDETKQGTSSPLATPTQTESVVGSGAVTDITASAEEEPQQEQPEKRRFSFYDAKEVGVIGVGRFFPSKDDNPNRFRFYDPDMIAADENLPNTQLNSQDKMHRTEEEDQRQTPKVEKASSAANNSDTVPVPIVADNDDTIQVPTEQTKKRENGNNNADEILRSLQETEVQRMQILQPATAPLSESSGSVLASGARTETDDVACSDANSITGVDIAASRAVAATDPATATAPATNTYTTPTYNNDSVNSNPNNINPYEDSIRAALTLLRKHRSTPQHSTSVNNDVDGLEPDSNDSNDIINNMNLDMDRNVEGQQDPILQGRSYDDDSDEDEYNKKGNEKVVDDAVQEAKMKSKQRQERMAKYASRLQEFKSSLPPEQQLQPHFHDNGEDDINDLDVLDKNESSPLELTQMEESEDREDCSSHSEQQLPNHFHRHIKPSLTEDSTGLVSELSQHSNNNYTQRSQHSNLPTQQQVIIEEQVQKGVEKVLMAILEASKNKSGIGGGGDSSYGDGSITNSTAQMDNLSAAGSAENANDALLQVLHELLPSSHSIDTGSINSRDVGGVVAATLSSKYSASIASHESSIHNRSRKSSVVDELLAEGDDEDYESKSKTTVSPATTTDLPINHNINGNAVQYWAEGDEKKMTDDRRYSENQQPSEIDTTSVILAVINQGKKKNAITDTTNTDIEKNEDYEVNDNSSLIESDASGEDDSVSRSSYTGEGDDDMDTTYDDEEEGEDSYEENENGEGHHVGVLGPLSREAGGTTGVVLDVESDSSQSTTREKGEMEHISSVANYEACAVTLEDEHQVLDNRTKREILAKYDVVGTTTNIQDDEATDLMRTLCAHLLPFGVDRNSILEESAPVWDEENPNEPGYRIIRLTKSQLRRVERAFDAMITRLKHNSHSSLNGLEGQFDENFIRELEEAERLLDDEEERKIQEKIEETASVDVDVDVVPKLQLSASVETTDEDEHVVDVSHPEFPGVRSAGKGEMGDLEYFQLPIIFKSHVTGFEPTKDMALEPGNIIAGQYLVESELGSAAFSTAYRCVDLSSEDNDGHEEVCLKVIKNTKDFFDQSLDEIKILELLRQTGKCDENYILRVKTFFYYREHLIIVTELLRQNLFEFGKFILDNDEEPYFTLPRLAHITRQCLISLRFVHNLGLVHSDVKPENILLGSYSRAQIKLIDFGSSCYLTDRQSSYIQSRSYRAPEVVLGLPYDGKIDVWSLGCVVAEMYTGDVTFQNDSIVSMLSRIEAFRGSFPRHMIAQGRQCSRFFTKSGLLYEVVGQSDEEGPSITPPAPDDEESDSDTEVEFDIFQPKNTQFSSRLGFDADLMDGYGDENTPMERKIEQMFTDFVGKLLTIDPDSRPSADEALQHPYMLYAASLTDEQIKYPSS